MPKAFLLAIAAVGIALAPAAVSASSYSLLSAEAFQDEGTSDVDVTSGLAAVDGIWSPADVTPTGTVRYDYYATGTSNQWFDAVNLTFDVAGAAPAELTDMTLWVRLRKGTYRSNSWEHYLLLPGLDNPLYEDLPPDGNGIDIEPGGTLASGSDYGWLGIPFDTALEPGYLSGDNAEMTLRLWNWQVDAVSLVSGQSPPELIPEPLTLLGVSCGLAGLGRYIRRRRTA